VTRLIAGSAGGRRLTVPPGTSTRPTSERAREALFSTLEALLHSLAGARFLDLYAGSGAVGLEALSRGAGHARLVEHDSRAVRTVEANVAATRLSGAVVSRERVEALVAGPEPETAYDVVFADPPYDLPDDDLRTVLQGLVAGGWLRAGSLLAVERATRGGEFRWPDGIEALRTRRYGEATLWYGRAVAGVRSAPESAAPERAGPTEE
jgi:16S rRNA (guanine966-N2)-methyltransferase